MYHIFFQEQGGRERLADEWRHRFKTGTWLCLLCTQASLGLLTGEENQLTIHTESLKELRVRRRLRTVHFLWPEHWQPFLGCFLLKPKNWRDRIFSVFFFFFEWSRSERSCMVLWDLSAELEGGSCPALYFTFVTPGIGASPRWMRLSFLEKLLWVGSPFSDDQNQSICYSLFYMNLNFSCLVTFGSPSSHRDELFMKSLLGMDYMLWCLISYTLMLNFRLASQSNAFWSCPQILEMNNTLNQQIPVGPWDVLKIL